MVLFGVLKDCLPGLLPVTLGVALGAYIEVEVEAGGLLLLLVLVFFRAAGSLGVFFVDAPAPDEFPEPALGSKNLST